MRACVCVEWMQKNRNKNEKKQMKHIFELHTFPDSLLVFRVYYFDSTHGKMRDMSEWARSGGKNQDVGVSN